MLNFILSCHDKNSNLVGFAPSFSRIQDELLTIVNFEMKFQSIVRTVWAIKLGGRTWSSFNPYFLAHDHNSNIIQNWLDWIHYNWGSLRVRGQSKCAHIDQ